MKIHIFLSNSIYPFFNSIVVLVATGFTTKYETNTIVLTSDFIIFVFFQMCIFYGKNMFI